MKPKTSEQLLLENTYQQVSDKSRGLLWEVKGQTKVGFLKTKAREAADNDMSFPWTIHQLTEMTGSKESALSIRQVYLEACKCIG